MELFRIIVPGQADILIQADDFLHEPSSDRVMFKRGKENVAIFQLGNIVGFVKVNKDGDQ